MKFSYVVKSAVGLAVVFGLLEVVSMVMYTGLNFTELTLAEAKPIRLLMLLISAIPMLLGVWIIAMNTEADTNMVLFVQLLWIFVIVFGFDFIGVIFMSLPLIRI